MNCYNLMIRNMSNINMSNWQITHIVNTLTTVNNKFDILKRLNTYINSGIKRKNIFIIDKSYLFSTNYSTYFRGQYIYQGQAQNVDIEKVYNMGKLISMECNEDIKNINILFEANKKISSILNRHLRCRLSKAFLNNAYEVLFEEGVSQAIEILCEGATEQITEIFSSRIEPDYGNMQKIIQKCNEVKKDKSIFTKYYQKNSEYEHKFEYYFNSCARPIIGIYDDELHSLLIINADHIYKNGEEAESQIKLNSITKNSPVLLAFTVVGVMGSVMGYLAYRNHKVNTVIDTRDILDVPSDRKEALENIIKSDDNNMLNDEKNNTKVDNKILGLAVNTYGKLEGITDNKKVKVEYSKKVLVFSDNNI